MFVAVGHRKLYGFDIGWNVTVWEQLERLDFFAPADQDSYREIPANFWPQGIWRNVIVVVAEMWIWL